MIYVSKIMPYSLIGVGRFFRCINIYNFLYRTDIFIGVLHIVIKSNKGGREMDSKKETINIQAKLNPAIDADLIIEISKIPKRDRSRTYREALRYYLKTATARKTD